MEGEFLAAGASLTHSAPLLGVDVESDRWPRCRGPHHPGPLLPASPRL